MDFDPARPPSLPRDAAAVILARARPEDGAAEVLLVRRTAKAAFMARAHVFPGGARDGEEDLRATAARELFEEAGVLLADRASDPAARAALRARAAAGEPLGALLAEAGLGLDLERLVPFAHWITPSAEKRRFSARFFLAELPTGQEVAVDGQETVEARWAVPGDALARLEDWHLPPPQLRSLWELRQAAARGPGALLALARERAAHVTPIVPRFALVEGAPLGFALLLPWDRDYESAGQGEGRPLATEHPLAGGPSRFVLAGELWRQVAPGEESSA